MQVNATLFNQSITPPLERAKNPSKTEIIQNTAFSVFKAIASGALFVVNSTFFCTGVLFSVIFPKESSFMLERITIVWDKQSISAKLITCVASVMALYYSISVGAFFMGASIGLQAAS